jgi:hypothetical protein
MQPYNDPMKATLALILIAFLPSQAFCFKDVSLTGYFREMPIYWQPPSYFSSQDYRLDNLFHARQNLRWYPSRPLTLGLDLKTRLIIGQSAQELSGLSNSFYQNVTYFDWTRAFVHEKDTYLISDIDRAWLDFSKGTLQITAGRQRIAWGTNLVWNTIDIFNPSSPFDFDNIEKPGTDAARAQFYLGPVSEIDIAVAPQREADRTLAAARLKFNKWQYDWHIIAGRRHRETLLGGAWAGSILGGGFRGELLYVISHSNLPGSNDYLNASISGDYTFKSSLYFQMATLYNGRGTTGKAGGIHLIESAQRGDLSPSKMSLFGEVARDISPLVKIDLSGILNPYDKSRYFGPSLDWSATADLDVTFVALIFGGGDMTEFGNDGKIFLLRIQYSF